MKRKLMSLLLTVAMTAAILAGCGKNGAEETAVENSKDGETVEGTEEAVQHLNAALTYMDPGLDPAIDYQGWVTSRMAVTECLVKLDENVEVEPCIAESWENVDETTWTFTIREGVKYHNGNDVTADSVKASIERAVAKNERAAELLLIDSITVDGQTLTIKTTKPHGALLNNLVEPVFGIIDTSVSDDEMNTAPVGTGAFMVSEFVPEQSVELVKNENYWRGEVGLDTVSIKAISDSDSRVMALQANEIDMSCNIDNTNIELFKSDDNYTVSTVSNLRVNTAHMNSQEISPLHDVELRRAVSYAVDRESYAGLVGGTAANSCFTDATPFGGNDIDAISFDREKAIQILDDNGYVDVDGDGIRENKDGSAMTLIYMMAGSFGTGDASVLATAVQADLKEVGVAMEIQALESSGHVEPDTYYDFFTSSNNSAITGDPQDYLMRTYGGNGATAYKNPKMDEIIEKLYNAFDAEERYVLAAEASQLLNDDAADLFLTNGYLNTVANAKVENAVQFTVDYYYLTHEISIK